MDRSGKIVYYSLGWLLIACMLTLLVMLSSGDRYSGILSRWGLYHEAAGAFASCSSAAGRGSKYCEPRQTHADKLWKSLSDPAPFSLNGT